METQEVLIPMFAFNRLTDSEAMLVALIDAGVENWDGYSSARQAFEAGRVAAADPNVPPGAGQPPATDSRIDPPAMPA